MSKLQLYPIVRGKRAEKPVAEVTAGVVGGDSVFRVEVPRKGTYDIVICEGTTSRSHGHRMLGKGERHVVV